MGLFKKSWVIAGLGVSLGMLSGAAAQPDAAVEAPVEVGVQRDVSLSPQQMLDQAASYLPEMEQGASSVKRKLAKARDDRDVVKVLCLNDKLSQMNVAIRSTQDRLSSLRVAVSQNDSDRSRHEFTVVQVLHERFRTLVSEANQCIGEEIGFVGESRVTVDIDPTIPDDPSEFPSEPGVISQPPVVSSPIQ